MRQPHPKSSEWIVVAQIVIHFPDALHFHSPQTRTQALGGQSVRMVRPWPLSPCTRTVLRVSLTSWWCNVTPAISMAISLRLDISMSSVRLLIQHVASIVSWNMVTLNCQANSIPTSTLFIHMCAQALYLCIYMYFSAIVANISALYKDICYFFCTK